VQITIAPGQTFWNLEFPEFNGINIFKAAPDKLSFVVSKIDGPLMVEPNVRIINDDGLVDTEGRIEIRTERSWQTVKVHMETDPPTGASGKNNMVAFAACRNLN